MSKQVGVLASLVTVAAATGFVVSWSSGFVIAAMATVDVAPATLLVWRFAPVAVALLAVSATRGTFSGVSPGEVRRQAVIGLFAQFGYCAFVYASVASGVAAGTTALIDAVQPLVVATLVGPLLGLRVRAAQWGGLVVGALGVLLVVGSQLGATAPGIAYLLPAAAMVCLVAATFLDRRSVTPLPVFTTLTIHITVTAAASLVFATVTGALVPPATPVFWIQIALMAAVPTLMAYGLYWWLLRRVGITALNALLFLVAPATALAGFVLLGEPLTGLTVVGFVLCGAGVAVVLASDNRTRAARAAAEPSENELAASAPSH